MLTINSVCMPQPDVVYNVVDGEAVLVLPKAGQIKVLNDVGTFIWMLLDGKRSIAEIADRVTREYRVDDDQAQTDTLLFLNDLHTRGIILVGDA